MGCRTDLQGMIQSSRSERLKTVLGEAANNIISNTYTLTVFDSSLPDSIIRRQSGIISVVNRKLITSCSSVCENIFFSPVINVLLHKSINIPKCVF